MPARRILAAVALAALAGVVLAAAACGSERSIVRIGVLSDCQGPFRGFQDIQLSGAELPFLRRGAALVGTAPSGGITAIEVGGRRVELVQGCQETGEHAVFIEETRRLLETEKVDAIVGGASVVTRDLAHKYPSVPFVATFWDEQELTLRRPAANLFRFQPDYAQQVAGLGAYAYRTLGWRRASVLGGGATGGWAGAAAFTAEFCALGGRVVSTTYRNPFAPPSPATIADETLRDQPDGVAVFLNFLDAPTEVLQALAARFDDPARRLLLWGPTLEDEQVLGALGSALDGVVGTSWLPSTSPSPVLRAYRMSYRTAYPGLPAAFSDDSFVIGYYNAVEAALTALGRVRGSDVREGLMRELGRLRIDLPGGPVSLDRNRQAVRDTYLSRIVSRNGKPTLVPVGAARSVEQTFGGLLSDAPPPGPDSQPCRLATPPPWAR
jgi:branched-chain amino acid transport system substrate-binding protein